MALAADEFRSGGQVFDGEGRRSVTIAGGAGLEEGQFRSGGRVWDADGREVVAAASVGSTVDEETLAALKAATAGYCIWDGSAYPARPAGHARVIFSGPEDPGDAGLGLMEIGDWWDNTTVA